MNKLINNIKNKITSTKNQKEIVPNKDYLIMVDELKKRNLENLNAVGTVMCHKCGKVTHIFDYEKGKPFGKYLDWYVSNLYWYCKDCSTNGKNEFINAN